MKKLLLIPAALVLSTGFAFADGWFGGGGSGHGLSLSQTANVTQSIGDTSGGSFALNRAFVLQAQVPINQRHGDLSQSASVDQSIGNTSGGSRAINRATVIQAQVPISFGTW